MDIQIRTPESDEDFSQYFYLRWRLLREPWGQKQGTEIDDMEKSCYHLMATCDDTVIGVGRLQYNSGSEAQIRYMAVDRTHERKGIGSRIIRALEREAIDNGREIIILDAREPAVGFYERCGYSVTEKSYLLFDVIQHYRMQKTLIAG